MRHKNTITQHKLSSKVTFNKWTFILHFMCLIIQAPQVWFVVWDPLNLFWNCVFQAHFSQSRAFHQIDFLKCKTCPYLVSSSCRLCHLIVYFIILFKFHVQEKLLKPFWLPWQLKWNFYKDSIFKAKDLVDTMNVMMEIIFQQTSLAYWLHLKFISESG